MGGIASASQMTEIELYPTPPDALELRIATNLTLLATGDDDDGRCELIRGISSLRRQTRESLGLVMPPVRIRDDLRYEPGSYTIKVRGQTVATGTVRLGRCLAFNPDGSSVDIEGEDAVEPIGGLPARWLESDNQLTAIEHGCLVITPVEQILAHLMQTVQRQGSQLLMREDVARLIENLHDNGYQETIAELRQTLPLAVIHRSLQRLLTERVPIRDLPLIFEHFVDAALQLDTKSPALIVEATRSQLGAVIAWNYLNGSKLEVLSLDARLDEELRSAVSFGADEPKVALPTDRVGAIVEAIIEAVNVQRAGGRSPVVACSFPVRRALSRLLQGIADEEIPVLSYPELDAVDFDHVGTAGAELLEQPSTA